MGTRIFEAQGLTVTRLVGPNRTPLVEFDSLSDTPVRLDVRGALHLARMLLEFVEDKTL